MPPFVPPTPTPVTPATEELRLAVTMTGGVSLAIWMGGAAREIELLMQASRLRRQAQQGPRPPTGAAGGDGKAARPKPTPAVPDRGGLRAADAADRDRYLALLELLDSVVEVDVLSGTSAGGINAMFLAYSRVRSGDLGPARELWLKLGALLDLLRKPEDNDLPSLLYGDRWLYKQLIDALPDLAPKPPQLPLPSTTLYVTTTLLAGETLPFTDALGTAVQNNTKRGLFTFTESDLAGEIDSVLALAARSTASFPGAFEPSFLPFSDPTPADGATPARPAVGRFANITQNHWVADGGLLDNQPLDVLLNRIFDRRARRRVRRVLLFVVPTTASPTSKPVAVADAAKPMGLFDGLLGDLGAVTSQSISGSLAAIAEHNDAVTARSDLRKHLADLASKLPARLLTASLFSDYCARESEKQARDLATAMLRVLSAWPAKSPTGGGIPKAWQAELANRAAVEQLCRRVMRDDLSGSWQLAVGDGGTPPADSAHFALLGQSAYDNGKSFALEILDTAYEAADAQEQREAIVAAVSAVHAATAKATRPDPGLLAEQVCAAAADPEDSSVRPLTGAAGDLADAWVAETAVAATAWQDLASALVSCSPTLVAIGSDSPDLQPYLSYFAWTGSTPSKPDGAPVAQQLFDLAVVEQALLPVGASAFQPVELVQLSADGPSLLAPKFKAAADKLTGLQFHHFGAFYKRTWRANDWMWGRLDGAGRLVQLLLDPRRLRLTTASPPGGKKSSEWLLERLKALGPVDLPAGPAAPPDGVRVPTDGTLLEELAFLDDPSAPLPAGLPLTASWAATAWQRVINSYELPALAGEVIGAPGADVDWSPADSRTWAHDVREPGADLIEQLNKCPVAKETFQSDMGSRLMGRTLTKAVATATGALATVAQLPKPIRPATTAIRTVAIGGYRIANAVGGRATRMIIGGLIAMVVGIAFAIQSSWVVGVSGTGFALIGGYAVAIGVWQWRRMLLTAVVGVTALLVVGVVCAVWARKYLFGSSGKPGWLGKHAYVLGEHAWYPALVLFGVVVVGTLVSAGLSWASRRR